jgi:hypothetical protein
MADLNKDKRNVGGGTSGPSKTKNWESAPQFPQTNAEDEKKPGNQSPNKKGPNLEPTIPDKGAQYYTSNKKENPLPAPKDILGKLDQKPPLDRKK